MGFIDQTTKQENFMALCDKARKLSSFAKLQGAKKLYDEKNTVLAKIIDMWPDKVSLLDDQTPHWHIFLEGFGAIHVEFEELPESSKRKLIYLQVDAFQEAQLA